MSRQDPKAFADQVPVELTDEELAMVTGGVAIQQRVPTPRQWNWGLEEWIEAGCPND